MNFKVGQRYVYRDPSDLGWNGVVLVFVSERGNFYRERPDGTVGGDVFVRDYEYANLFPLNACIMEEQ